VDLLADAQSLRPELIELRQALHREPEVGLHLPGTQERLLEALRGLPLEITTGTETTSVTGVLRGGATATAPGAERTTVLLRGDMDALPVDERSGEDFAATNGAMHACGHDLHSTALVGAARLLCAHRDRLAGDVVFMFQPGEEGWDGAAAMIREGVLVGCLSNWYETQRLLRDPDLATKLGAAGLIPNCTESAPSASKS